MHDNIYWCSWPIFFLRMNAVTDTQTHSQRFLPAFGSDYIKHPGCTNRVGQTSLCSISANSRGSDSRHATLDNSFKRCGSTTQPRLLQSVMNTGPVCCWQKRGPLLACTQIHKKTHTFIRWSKYFTLPGCSPHDHSTQFSPVTHAHTRTFTMKLIDYFTKNQLGAGYVRTLRARKEGDCCELGVGGERGKRREEWG